MQLAKNFTLKEMLVSQTASRNGFSEQWQPSLDVISNLTKLAQNALQPIRDQFGIINITSGYRCLRVNRAIGSSDSSDHVRGYAADFVSPTLSELTLAKWTQKNINYDQLILEFGTLRNPSWLHLSVNPRMRNQILHIGKSGIRVLTRAELQSL
ncbi:D-Ala-D-Ala carboxypeptidase family metallohydrolase (plasmid) [Synechocystis sp. B12]|nr:D-Ala-D-Ala carboxypeptidase family metallohydrolase [Synechocystis sp. B12]